MFLAGAKNLEAHKDIINELNVFPVPDGDTGTNMTMTVMSAAKEVAELVDDAESLDMKVITKAISSGSLRGARGNSGVIMSQLCRGFCKIIGGSDEIDRVLIARASERAVESAYKAVMKPKEGTILTVAKAACEKAVELSEDESVDLDGMIDAVIAYAKEVLEKTPEMLPVLKEAGVVDSGGAGLVEFLVGAQAAFRGEVTDFSLDATEQKEEKKSDEINLKYPYKTVITSVAIRNFNIKQENDFIDYLASIGENAEVKVDGDKIDVDVQTADPGLVIQKVLTFANIDKVTVENIAKELMEMNTDTKEAEEEAPMEHKAVGFISVSVGDGINSIFKDLGVDRIIEGGQTMNPSTEDILSAIEKVNADTIFLYPNNKNIVMAANQARDLTKDKKIIVIPTKNIPQGITALITFVPELSDEENEAAMNEEIGNVSTGQVTYSVRDTEIDGFTIHENDIMGIGDKGMLAVGTDMAEVSFDMIGKIMEEKEDAELISIYYGADVTEADAEALKSKVEEAYSDCDVELQYGGQPVYYYVVSVE
ncbi:MAG: DAK2 domain-containing protein [Lachnospiraceae bacterium]|nr:DAK2 domain-containing protein [Lachnospiraceae bacterium]